MRFVMSTMLRCMFTIAMIFTLLNNLHGLEYKVTTFIENNNPNTTIDSRGISNNTEMSTTYINLPYKGGLDGIYAQLYIVSRKTEENIAANLYTSFTSTKTSHVVQEILNSRNKRAHQIQLNGCLQVPEDVALQNEKCQKFRTEYIALIVSLIKNLHLYPIAIITDHDECSNSFSKKLMQELIKMGTGPDKTAFYQYKIEKTSEIKSDLPKILYDIKTKSVTLIIVLSDDIISELIFKYAAALSLLSFNEIWLTIDFKLELDDNRAPSQLLTITGAKSSQKQTQASNRELIAAMNLMLLSKVVNGRSNASSMITELWRTESLSKMKAATCDKQYNSPATTFVSLRKSKYNWVTLYKWDIQNNLVMVSSDTEFARFSRTKLLGITLRVATAFEPPFMFASRQYYNKDAAEKCQKGLLCRVPEIKNASTKWQETCCIGYIMDMLGRLRKDLWFNTDLYVVEDGYYGEFTNGSWNGLVGDVTKGKADLAVAALTASTHRSTVVHFSESFLEVSLAILLKSKQVGKIKFLNFAFISFLSGNLLWAILGVFIGGMILVYVLENHSIGWKRNSQRFPLRECFTYFSGLTFQRDLGGRNPMKVATRITAITFAFAMVVIMTTYTAILTAVKVKQEVTDTFLGMKDPKMTHPTSDFKYGCIQSSSTTAFFQNSENLVYRNMYLFMKNYNTKNTEDGVKYLKSGYLQAYITEYPMAQYYISKQRDCGLAIVSTHAGKSSWAIASKKGWSWNHVISQKLLEYKENEILADMYKKWTKSSCTSAFNNTSTLQSIKIEYFGGLIIILIGCFGFSLLLLLIENVLKQYRGKTTKPVKSAIELLPENKDNREGRVTITSFKKTSGM